MPSYTRGDGEIIDLDDYLTVNEVSTEYEIKATTIRSYISRNQVIPKDKITKVGNTWFIDKDFAEEKWKKRKKE